MNRRLTYFALLLFLGCSHTEIVQPEQLKPDAWQNISVYTQDGRIIKMLAGNYSIVKSADTSIIRGTGREVVRTKRYEIEPFSGDIPFQQIISVETTERAFLTRTLPMMAGFIVMFYLFALYGSHNP